MANSYEVILQQVAETDLLALLKVLERNSQAFAGLTISEDFGGEGLVAINEGLIDAVIAYEGEVCLMERLYGFKVSEEISLPLVLLRVVKYKGGVDVELSFNDVSCFDINCVMLAMRIYSVFLSGRFHIKEFYGGLEPAMDVDTRYFTGNTLGPLG
ncbi:hypothetical protein [Pseudomonas indica]|uniref:hypothetical protein n=1 Tax=Pseudomonas indica TaxID=137658 RepID=UPI000BAB58FE|nr:hypothetical protein [Pseudomonas indica]PAU61157.1 hypothetical protein BZL42_08125 [Pseudomonas indica]